MAHPLDGARAKLARGRYHLGDLRARTHTTFNSPEQPRARLVTQIDTSDQTCVLTVADLPTPPPEYALIITEAAHSFRSALNYVVAELAWIDTRGDSKIADQRQQFPIERVPAEWKTKRVQSVALNGLTKHHKALIEGLQPYQPIKHPPPHPLVFLRDLTNDDKHRLLHVLTAATSAGWLTLPYRGRDCRVDHKRLRHLLRARTKPPKVEVGAEIARVPLVITGPQPALDVQFAGIGFLAVGESLSVLDEMDRVARVVEHIVEGFAPEFERPVARRVWSPRPGDVDKLVGPSIAPFALWTPGPDWPPSARRGLRYMLPEHHDDSR